PINRCNGENLQMDLLLKARSRNSVISANHPFEPAFSNCERKASPFGAPRQAAKSLMQRKRSTAKLDSSLKARLRGGRRWTALLGSRGKINNHDPVIKTLGNDAVCCQPPMVSEAKFWQREEKPPILLAHASQATFANRS